MLCQSHKLLKISNLPISFQSPPRNYSNYLKTKYKPNCKKQFFYCHQFKYFGRNHDLPD